jgi:pimeloyl-ACP methyl ester carboxylesterase
VKKYTIKIAGLAIELLDSAGDGDVIFLLHGNSSSAYTFISLYDSELAKRYRLIAINLPAHWGSTPMAVVSIPSLADLMCQITDFFAFSRYLVIGHSLGGHILSHALPRLSGCLGLVLVSAPPLSLSTISQAFKPDPVGGALFTDDLEAAQVNMMAAALLGRISKSSESFKNLTDSIRATSGSFRSLLGQSLMAGHLENEQAAILAAQVPVAMIWGQQDLFIAPEFYQQITLNNVLGEGFYPFINSGHSPHIDNSIQFIRIISDIARTQLMCEGREEMLDTTI